MSSKQNNTQKTSQNPAEGTTKQYTPMDVDVRINELRTGGSTLATASVTINGSFAVRGVKVVRGKDGPFVSMPSYHGGSGYRDVCFPCTKEFKAKFDQAVLGAYQQQMGQIAAQHTMQGQDQSGFEQEQGGMAMGGMAM